MSKKFYFLAGMHRSGNTLLSAILNQNPRFYVSPISPFAEFMWRCSLQDYEDAITNPRKSAVNNMISNMIKNYYEDIDKPVIFDRAKSWASPDNIEMIRTYIDSNPKIIFTVRPLSEVIASMININKIITLNNMYKDNYSFNDKISVNDNIANYLLNDNIYAILKYANISISDIKYKNNIHIVKYNDLCDYPEKTLTNIYNFLDEEFYEHDFKKIQRKEIELDGNTTLPIDIHKIRKHISKSTLDPKILLSQEMIDKCNSLDLFYN